MTKFTVMMHYQADVPFEIDANSPEEAEAIALRQAYSEIPNNLFAEVAYIDEVENENTN